MMIVIDTSYGRRHIQVNRRNIRHEMITGAINLLAERGVYGTSFAVVTEATDTPRGSIYHHFPGGKNELIEEAVASIGSVVKSLIDAVDASSPIEVVEQFVGSWRALLLANNFVSNCAVANVSLGADDSLRDSAGGVFTDWRESLTRAFERSGVDRDDAVDFADVCLAAVEGAMILGRASRSDDIFDALTRQLSRLVS